MHSGSDKYLLSEKTMRSEKLLENGSYDDV